MRIIEREILLLLSRTETDIGRFESKADIRLSLRDQFTSGQVNYAITKLIKNGYIKTVMNRGLYQITSKGRSQIGVTTIEIPEDKYPEYIEKEEPIIEKDLSPEGLRKREQAKPKAKWTPQRFEYDEETEEYKVIND